MLEVQQYLRADGTLESLAETLGINVYRHPSLPLVGFKYNQIESPKYHPIVRECRGLVLEDGTWNLVAKPFGRFFNVGEEPDAYAAFDWSDFDCTTKEDGSLIIVYRYAGEWHANTSGSFGLGNPGSGYRGTWRDLFWRHAGITEPCRMLAADVTWLFELCTPWNKIVRAYAEPQVYLLGAFMWDNNHVGDLTADELDDEAARMGLRRPERHHFSNESEIRAFLEHKAATDATFEGVVIRDRHGVRFKLKSESYLRLHHMHDNGNLFNPKRLIPIILNGEKDEVLSYFPEVRGTLEAVDAELEAEYAKLRELWEQTRAIESQRDFALAIVKATPFSGILFNVRKIYGESQTEGHLRDQWRRNSDALVRRYVEREKSSVG